MSRRTTIGLLSVAIVAALTIIAGHPSLAESITKNAQRTHHAVHDRRTPCERDPRCLESLSRAAAYGNLNSPHHPSAHRSVR